MKVGEWVKPKASKPYVLRTGCGYCYDGAVVMSLDPFVLVSEEADMKWSCTVTKEDVEATGQMVLGYVYERCLKRMQE